MKDVKGTGLAPDDFREMHRQKMAKRAVNRETSGALLAHLNVPHEVKNGGAHLIVKYGHQRVDLWPGTGLWKVHGRDIKGRGVRNMLRYLGVPLDDGDRNDTMCCPQCGWSMQRRNYAGIRDETLAVLRCPGCNGASLADFEKGKNDAPTGFAAEPGDGN